MIVGYFRQIDEPEAGSATTILRAERCLRIESDPPTRRDARSSLIDSLSNGDVLVTPSILHLAGFTAELLRVAQSIHARGATLRLVAERIDTAVPAARNVLAALAEFERRQMETKRAIGLAEAEARGARPGRPRKIDASLLRSIQDEIANGGTYGAVARRLGVHPTTVMRLLGRAGE
ncbi:site-specific recombinase [Paramagnetospirillum marisnigri]|uniref:Site-specific recombinase n=1 Tax=Paramagnetospirillum marisnigri TaxID=1285242 RepID=A0A178MQ71_9PROT|nr:recombinase family protein [Paramagnetospirillum marisnigri]OAN50663.1 site-specific recombinase [Paramagnetospirillum marisnigri]